MQPGYRVTRSNENDRGTSGGTPHQVGFEASPVTRNPGEARMLTKVWSRLRSQAVWTLLLIVGAPTFVQAQQTGLFPLRPIRRERVPCPAEDPVYRLHREQFYGYFPTCWRRFPPGWGCMSPEAPDPAASYKKYPRTPPPSDAMEGDQPGAPGAMPDEPDQEGAPRPGGGAAPGPNPLPTPPPSRGNLFELDDTKPGNAPNRPAPPPGSNPNDLPPPGSALSPRTAPDSKPSAGLMAPGLPTAGLAPREAAPGGGPDALLALPENPGAGAPPNPVVNPLPPVDAPTGALNEPVPGPGPTMQPEQAPQRRSLLGGLFSGLRRR